MDLVNNLKKLKNNFLNVKKERTFKEYKRLNTRLLNIKKRSFEKNKSNSYGLDKENIELDGVLDCLGNTIFDIRASLTTDLIGFEQLHIEKEPEEIKYTFYEDSLLKATADNVEDVFIDSGFAKEMLEPPLPIPYCVDLDYQISTHFKLGDFVRSNAAARLGLSNLPDEREFNNICAVAQALEVIWAEFGEIRVNSGFRSPIVNAAVKGSKASDHMHGAAADITTPSDTTASNCKLFFTVKKLHLEGKINTRQIIWEYGDSIGPSWVHVAVKHSMAPGLSNNHILAIGSNAGNKHLQNMA